MSTREQLVVNAQTDIARAVWVLNNDDDNTPAGRHAYEAAMLVHIDAAIAALEKARAGYARVFPQGGKAK